MEKTGLPGRDLRLDNLKGLLIFLVVFGHLLELLTEAAISWEYAISRSVVTNGTASNSVIEHVTPYWQTAITAEIAVTGILTAVFFVLLVLSKTKKKVKKQ